MIKFWKSAAKGKTGCPVRPPELNTPVNFENKLLENVLELANDESNDCFDKKSQLSPNFHDILIGKKGLKHFISFMENIGKDFIINCWIDLEKFQFNVIKTLENQCANFNKDNLVNKSLEDINSTINNELSVVSNSEILRTSSINLNRSRNDLHTNSNGNTNLNPSFEDANRSEALTNQAIHLFKKYVALEAPIKLELTDTERKIVISNICQPEGKITSDCFKPVQDALFNQMETNYFGHFVNSSYYIKSQIDILTSGPISLRDILYNETILFYFTEYLEQESCRILLEFLIAVTHFKDNLSNKNSTPEQTQSDAIVLYDKYFSLQATSPIGFPTDIRLKVESDICSEKGPLVTCFDTPYKIIFKTLSGYVKFFLDSEIYYTYLSEMIKSVDQLWSANLKSHSDCSSEFSVSTQNTLLAMGDPLYKKKRNHSVPDMTIDSNQLYNADALWQRKKHDGLSLGRINSLGRFESKFEPDPDKNNKSVLKRMVSKLVPTNTSNVKEEMAWQIAHMIVKDITDLTMSAPENDSDHV